MVERDEDARFLDALWLNVPSCEVILQHANESFFGVWAILRAKFSRTTVVGRKGRSNEGRGERNGSQGTLVMTQGDNGMPLPKDEIGVGHEVRDTFEHTARLENERRERHL